MSDGSTNLGAQKVLVSGASGFIGRNLVKALLQRGCQIRALVRNKHQLEQLSGVEYFRADLTEPQSLDGIENDIDVAVHCAGTLGKWGTPPALLHQTNVDGSVNLLKRFRGSRLKRFIHLSAGGVSGPLPQGIAGETTACLPLTLYEKSKYEAEQKVLELSREIAVPLLVVRPTFTYGPLDPHKLALFRAVKKRHFAFIGGGKSLFHPVYIDDLTAGIITAAEKGRDGEVYIIGGDRPVTKKEFVFTIADALHVQRPWINIPRRVAWPAAYTLELLGRCFGFEPLLTRSRVMMMGDDFGYSIEKAKNRLGYAPGTELKEGISATVKSYYDKGWL